MTIGCRPRQPPSPSSSSSPSPSPPRLGCTPRPGARFSAPWRAIGTAASAATVVGAAAAAAETDQRSRRRRNEELRRRVALAIQGPRRHIWYSEADPAPPHHRDGVRASWEDFSRQESWHAKTSVLFSCCPEWLASFLGGGRAGRARASGIV